MSFMVAPLQLRPASDGSLLGWLVAGPYAFDFAGDPLGGEANVSPVENSTWHFAIADVPHGLDLKAHFRFNQSAVAYCYSTLEVAAPVKARLLFGSDDGAKVYLNGTQIFSRDIKRGVKRDEEQVPISLVAGENRLLFKIEQYDGGWGLMARIVDEHGSPIRGLRQVLSVEPGGTDRLTQERKWAGKAGSFDIESAQRFSEVRDRATLFLNRMRSSINDPSRLTAVLRESRERIDAADDADKASDALHRGVERVGASFDEARRPLLEWAQKPGECVKTDPAKEDYVHVLPGGRYFAHADGTPFIPIGANHNPDWPELEESNPLGRVYDPDRTERWFANLEKHGVNVIRLMVETPPSGNLEEKVGTFRPEHVIWLDHIFNAARKHNVKLWITPYDTFWMSLKKETSPYWAENGGPIQKPIDFLTKPEIMAAQKRRMKYLIDRYGNSGTVFAWEIMNEIDLWWDATPPEIKAWADEMSKYVHEYERQKWGRNHMVTMSMATPEPKDGNADTAFRRSDFDFATMHLYLGASKGPKPGEASKAGIDFAEGVTYARSQVRDNRPVLDGESGPIDKWIDDEKFDDEVFHEMSWRHLMAGGAGPGTRWPYRNPHHITVGMLETLHSMRLFCDGVDWKQMTGPTQDVQIQGPEGSESPAFGTDKGTIAWLKLPPEAKDRRFTILWPSPRHSKVRGFDVSNKKWIEMASSASDGAIQITVPTGSRELALWLEG